MVCPTLREMRPCCLRRLEACAAVPVVEPFLDVHALPVAANERDVQNRCRRHGLVLLMVLDPTLTDVNALPD